MSYTYSLSMIYKFIFSLVAILLIVYIVVQLLEIEKEKNEIIKVQITLDNKCELFDKVFMVKAIPSGKLARFIDKKAEMFLEQLSCHWTTHNINWLHKENKWVKYLMTLLKIGSSISIIQYMT